MKHTYRRTLIATLAIAAWALPSAADTATLQEVVSSGFATVSVNGAAASATLEGFDSELGELKEVSLELDSPLNVIFGTSQNIDPNLGLPLPYAFTFEVEQRLSSSAGGSYSNPGEWIEALAADGTGQDAFFIRGIDVDATIAPEEDANGAVQTSSFDVPPARIEGSLADFTDQPVLMTVNLIASITSTSGPPVFVDSVNMPTGITLTYGYDPVPEPAGSGGLLALSAGVLAFRRRGRD